MQIIQCKVEKIEDLTDTIKRIVLIPDSPLSFNAGQYLQIVMDDDDKRPFSIANAPRADGSIELHIGAEPGNQYAGQVIEKMIKDKSINVEGGLGEAFLSQSDAQATILGHPALNRKLSTRSVISEGHGVGWDGGGMEKRHKEVTT